MKRLTLISLGLAVLILCGFVPLAEKTLAKCENATPTAAKSLKITLNSNPGKLLVGEPGKHSIVFEDGKALTDPGLEALSSHAGDGDATTSKYLALWRYLDFHSPARPKEFLELLSYCSIDANRRGWVRLDETGDRLGLTIGAAGESERDLPQIWIDRATNRIARLSLPNGSAAQIGPSGADGLPQWIALDSGKIRLQIIQPEAPAKKK